MLNTDQVSEFYKMFAKAGLEIKHYSHVDQWATDYGSRILYFLMDAYAKSSDLTETAEVDQASWPFYPNGKFKVYRFGHRIYPDVKEYQVNTDDPKYTNYLIDEKSVTIDVWNKFCEQYPKHFDIWQYVKSLPPHIRSVKKVDSMLKTQSKFDKLSSRISSLEKKIADIEVITKHKRRKGFWPTIFKPFK